MIRCLIFWNLYAIYKVYFNEAHNESIKYITDGCIDALGTNCDGYCGYGG